MKRDLILTIDLTGVPTWQEHAMQRQMGDWIQANKAILPFENLIIMPTKGETRLYWLDGHLDDPHAIKTLEEIKERIQPVLSVALDLKLDRDKKYKNPYAKKIRDAIAGTQ